MRNFDQAWAGGVTTPSPLLSVLMNGVLAFAFFAVLTSAPPARAFGVINGFGQHAEHAAITRLGLKDAGLGPQTLAAFAGGQGRFGAVGAADRPDRGLSGQKSAHCDGADHLPGDYPQSSRDAGFHLSACRAWIQASMAEAVRAAGALVDGEGKLKGAEAAPVAACRFNAGAAEPARCRTLTSLGLAMHAAQDFYSHSNWADLPGDGPVGVGNPPGLGMSGQSDWLWAAPEVRPHPGLITGCYDGFPEAWHCSARVRHRDLSKDTGAITATALEASVGTTARGSVRGNFGRAVSAAVADTRARWSSFEAEVRKVYGPSRGDLILCVVKADEPARCQTRREAAAW